MTRVVIVGVGSPLGDDQAGWRVIDCLKATDALSRVRHEVRAVALDRPGPALLEQIGTTDQAAVHHAIVIDAIASGAAPGTIYHFEDETALQRHCGISSHGFGIVAAIALGRALKTLPPALTLYGIEIGEPVAGGNRLSDANGIMSPPVLSAAEELAARILADLRSLPQATT